MSMQLMRPDQRIALPGRDIAQTRRNRSRHVRMSYPAALVELALLLCGTFGARRATSELGIGLATLYRWKNAYRTVWTPRYRKGIDGRPDRWDEVASQLFARCERAGFPMRSSLVRRSVLKSTGDAAACAATVDHGEQTDQLHCTEMVPIRSKRRDISEKMIHAKREIDNNYAYKQSIGRLAGFVGMPRIKFIKEFSATFGVTPYRYLLSVRFRQAMALLEYSKASFDVVAASTGFGSASSMHRAFKRFAGVAPARLMNAIAPQHDVMVGIFKDANVAMKTN